ncbi:unnamed protein product [Miscanthus lutarioriparius]|uniref:ENTH domain-containing protein n=1 Tax=Miscanthus lutarioriparius TaxID=422564 RepID=A0A811S4E9_9POAL|nr:unnamed protein product [Miscanthus lutarioriparius]
MGSVSVQKRWRKACGAIKDSATVGIAKVNSGGGRERKDLDVAVVKATTHVERPPKERHVAAIFAATSSSRPLTDVSYCVHALAKRLSKTRNWVVALKTLIVIHRTLREGDAAFREELLGYRRNGHALRMSNFKDDSSPQAWDCSAWVRTYALYLEERLECFRVLRYDIESERLRPAEGDPRGQSRTRTLGQDDLLEQLPALQQLLFRLVSCQVLKESFKVYCALNDGIINLVDLFFDMTKLDAIKALDIYRRTGNLPPPSFLGTMEEYIREDPRTAPLPNETIEYQQLDFVIRYEKEQTPELTFEAFEEPVAEEAPPEHEEPAQFADDDSDDEPETPTATADLLGLHEVNPAAAALEESNALALAIVPPGKLQAPFSAPDCCGSSNASAIGLSEITGSSGWELALVTAQPSSSNQLAESKLAGGFDRLLLDSLYEDGARRQQQATMNAAYGNGHASDQQNDPFAMSNGVAPPTGVQMSMIARQQQAMFGMPQQLQFQPQYGAAAVSQFNPFGDAYSVALSSQGAPLHGSGGSLI